MQEGVNSALRPALSMVNTFQMLTHGIAGTNHGTANTNLFGEHVPKDDKTQKWIANNMGVLGSGDDIRIDSEQHVKKTKKKRDNLPPS